MKGGSRQFPNRLAVGDSFPIGGGGDGDSFPLESLTDSLKNTENKILSVFFSGKKETSHPIGDTRRREIQEHQASLRSPSAPLGAKRPKCFIYPSGLSRNSCKGLKGS